MRVSCVLAAALAVAGPALSQPADTKAEWMKQPTRESLLSAMPVKALTAGVGGQATIACVVTIEGALRNCRPQSETPAGMGFGGAAVALSGQFLMKPATRGGQPVESQIAIPITFADPGPARNLDRLGARRTRLLSNAAWRTAPSAADVLAAWPEKAKAAGKGGNAVLDCNVLPDGDLNECKVLREEPFGAGFAGAAQQLVRKFAAPPWPDDMPSTDKMRTQVVFSFPAQALTQGGALSGKPRLLVLPKQQDMVDRLPPAAKAAGVLKARVVMTCAIAANGGLEACNTDSEDPPGLGYGAAAADLGKITRVSLWTVEGLPTIGGKVTLPMRFDLSGLATAPPP